MAKLAISFDVWYYIPTMNQYARGMFVIKSENLCFAYSSTEDAKKSAILTDININITKGEFVVILGRNGSGKSTLAKHLNALLAPTSGSLWVRGLDTSNASNTWAVRQSTGMVFQNPDNQIVATLVEDDVAFGPENLGVPPREIVKRVDENLEIVNMGASKKTAPHLLSGGQKQRVAIAGILAMKPSCIVFDEATAMLDPSGRKEVLGTAHKLNKEDGITIILITHLMEETLDADRVIVMNKGKIEMDGTPKKIFADYEKIQSLGISVPYVTELCSSLKKQGMNIGSEKITCDDFINDEEIKKILKNEQTNTVENIPNGKNIFSVGARIASTAMHVPTATGLASPSPTEYALDGEYAIEVTELSHIYNQGSVFEKQAISNINMKIKKGELAAIIGHTGSGKSTLIQHLNALLTPTSGTVKIVGENIHKDKSKFKYFRQKVGVVFQYPEHQLFESTVLRDVSFGPMKMNVVKHLIEVYAKEALAAVGLGEDCYGKSPFELSGGQKRRVAIAGVLAMRPNILILDEPTAGLDPSGKKEILGHIKHLHESLGITIILVSHSMDDVAEHASNIFVMNDGAIKLSGSPHQVFSMDEELKSIGLDVPKITGLFIKLHGINKNIPKCIISMKEAEEAMLKLYREVNP